MALDKAIAHGKEHRTPYRHSAAFDRSCRNHGRCGYCRHNRTYNHRKRLAMSEAEYTYWLYEPWYAYEQSAWELDGIDWLNWLEWR